MAEDEYGGVTIDGLEVYDVELAADPSREADVTLMSTLAGSSLELTEMGDSGLSITSPACSATVGGACVRLQGSLDAVNLAMSTITYTPPSNTHGEDLVTVTASDQGALGAGGESTAACCGEAR